MTEIKIPKYKEVVLEFTATQVHKDTKIWLPYLNYRKNRHELCMVFAGNYILTDQFGNQWQCSEEHFKNGMEQV